MVCKLINLINAKLEEMYDTRVWYYTTIIQAIVLDSTNFCTRDSQLTQLTSPECSDQMKWHQTFGSSEGFSNGKC